MEKESPLPGRSLPSLVLGSVCLAFGLMWLADTVFSLNFFTMGRLWPLFVLVPGLAFEYYHYSVARTPGFLVPGGILTVLGTLFFFETLTGWRLAAYTWPIYILAVIAGLAQLSAATGSPRGLVAVIAVLGIVFAVSSAVIACVLLFAVIPYRIIVPVALIAIGGYLLIGNPFKRRER